MLVVPERADFVALVRAFTCRNEPRPVPDSQGATMVSGYINWDRIRRHRLAWEQSDGARMAADSWESEFGRLTARPELYQDRFIILSEGAYSGVSASDLQIPSDEWRDASLVIRREHECAHYFTKRVFGSMQNKLHDELLADFAGITAACGSFRADWFLRFMGLEAYPRYREGARLQNYRGDPPLGPQAFAILHSLVVRAARALERFCASVGAAVREPRERVVLLLVMARLTLDQLGGEDADSLLARAYVDVDAAVRWRDADAGVES
jgi:hypothetical protein